MGRMTVAEAAAAAAAARARQAVEGQVNALEAELSSVREELSAARRQYEELETRRSFERRRADESEKLIKKLEAEHGSISKIKSQTVRDTHAAEIAEDLKRFDPADIIPLVMGALHSERTYHTLCAGSFSHSACPCLAGTSPVLV